VLNRVSNWHLKMSNKSNLAFLKSFSTGNLGLAVWHFLAVLPYFGSSILDLAVTIKTGIILSPGSIHYQHL